MPIKCFELLGNSPSKIKIDSTINHRQNLLMARPLRIEYENAVWILKKEITQNKASRQLAERLAREVMERRIKKT